MVSGHTKEVDVGKIGVVNALKDILYTIQKDKFVLANVASGENYENFMMMIRLQEMTSQQLFLMSYSKDFSEADDMINQLKDSTNKIIELFSIVREKAEKYHEAKKNENPCTAK